MSAPMLPLISGTPATGSSAVQRTQSSGSYGFRPAKRLGMVPMQSRPVNCAPDHVAELALIEMSRLQRQTLRRWNDALLVAGLSPAEADAICPTGATIINLEARKAK